MRKLTLIVLASIAVGVAAGLLISCGSRHSSGRNRHSGSQSVRRHRSTAPQIVAAGDISCLASLCAKDTANLFAGRSARLDPARVSGMIVIAIRPKTMGTAGHECIVSIRVTVDKGGKSAGAGTGLISGRLPDFVGFGFGNEHGTLTLADGGKRDLFELRLR